MRMALALVITVLTGCKVEIPKITIEGGAGGTSETVPFTLNCTAVANGGLHVTSGEMVSVMVNVSGTYGPFTSLEVSGEFAGSAEVFRTYKNDGENDLVVSDSVVIKDGKGFEKSCPFQVVVKKAPTASDLACVLTSERSVVNMNEGVNLTLTAAGGSRPYAFGDLEHSGITLVSLEKRSDIHAAARVMYTSVGFKTLSSRVSDSRGVIRSCSLVIEVERVPSLPALPPCTASTSFNPSFIGESVIVTASAGVSIDMNLGPAILVDVSAPWEAQMEVYGRLSDTQAEVSFYNSGLFSVVTTMEYLLSGRRVQCSTLHSVYDGYWW